MAVGCSVLLFRQLQKKKKSATAVSEPAAEDTSYQLPAMRQSDAPVTPPVTGIISVLVNSMCKIFLKV